MSRSEQARRRIKTIRITLRVPEDLLCQLKEKADTIDVPLNSMIIKILVKNNSFERNVERVPSIIISYSLLLKIIDQLDATYLEQLARESPTLVKKYFTILGLQYGLNEVIQNHLFILGKYCGWFKILHESSNSDHRLIIETQHGNKWTQFIALYVKNLLESLEVYKQNVVVNDNLIVFEFRKN